MKSMEINAGSYHSKIIGNFGESFVCNWLSRSGFEVALVDHTGIDIVAYHPSTERRMGITVKSRTRTCGKEHSSVNLFFSRKADIEKVKAACQTFCCEPWVAVYVETSTCADLYLTSLEHYERNYRSRTGKAIDDWKMGLKYQEEYKNAKDVKHIRIEFQLSGWNW